MATEPRPILERFEEKFIACPVSGCWLWTAGTYPHGYGCFFIGSRADGTARMAPAHRVAYELYVGPIPEGEGWHGTCVCHRCDVRLCVNPAHLFLGSQRDNVHDRDAKGRGNQPRGERNAALKLPAAEVPRVFELRGRGMSQQAVADSLGVSQSLVSQILRGVGNRRTGMPNATQRAALGY